MTGAWLGPCGVGQAWHKCFAAWHGLQFWASLKWSEATSSWETCISLPNKIKTNNLVQQALAFVTVCVQVSKIHNMGALQGAVAAHSIAECVARK
jgi:hypothetical protein